MSLDSTTSSRSNIYGLLRRLLQEEGRKHVRGYALAFFFMGLVAATTALTAYLMSPVVKYIFIQKQGDYLMWLGGAIVAVYIVKGLASYAQQTTMARIGNRIIAGLQTKIFDHLLVQPLSFFTERHSSELISRNSFIASSVRESLSMIITAIGRDVLSALGLIVVMISQDPLLSLVVLVTMPPAILGSRYLKKRVKKLAKRRFTGMTEIATTIQETTQGVRVIKSFALEEIMRGRMHQSVQAFQRIADKIALLSNRSSPMMETLAGLAIAGVVMYGGWRVIGGAQDSEKFFAFITAVLMAYEPLKRLSKLQVDLNTSLIGVKMYFDFLDTAGSEDARENAKPVLRVDRGQIEFDHVSFGYRPDEPVLRDLSLVVEGGKTTALVGQSGGGKSTIVNLIMRLYHVDAGQIRVDGQPIEAVALPSLRAAMAHVGQDVFLFAGSIRDNIAAGRPRASEAEIIAAAKAAHAHEFISQFERGYATPVGERGLQLSGGQRARIAIARAVLKDAPIILLDEATAALDSESEVAVQMALEELCANRTVVVIAHRLQTVLRADKICVVENGRIVEEGTHAELLARGGRYFHLHAVHFRDEPHRRSA